MRRSKAIAGMVAKMRKGHWVGIAPTGYRWDKNEGIIVPDEKKGPLISKAFQWKYQSPKVSNEEIRMRLKDRGLRICKQSMSNIFRNPAYCGLIAHSLLKGEVLPGLHKPLVSKSIFLAVNKIMDENTQGWRVDEEKDALPLKRFARCSVCDSPLTGYLVKAKGIYYYKCSQKGCGSNKNAAKLGEMFRRELDRIQVRVELIPYIAQELRATIYDANQSKFDEIAQLKKRRTEAEKKIKRLKDRYIIDEAIDREDYEEYKAQFEAEIVKITDKIETTQKSTSNLLDGVEGYLQKAANLAAEWDNGDYRTKQELQEIAFPDGVVFDKKSDRLLTARLNELFRVSSEISQVLEQIGHKKRPENRALSTWAPPLGLEPRAY